MFGEIVACRSHIEWTEGDEKTYLTYLVKPSIHFSVKIDDEEFRSNDFSLSFDDKSKPIQAIVNIFDNNFMNKNYRIEHNFSDETIGKITLLNFNDKNEKSLFYQVYFPTEIFNRIVQEAFIKLPKEVSLSAECEDGSFFNDEWIRGDDKKYIKPNITQFHHFIDLK